MDVFEEIFAGNHDLPDREFLPGDPRVIFDLGANIGLAVAHMAVLFPQARIVGVELDGENAELCRANIAPWEERCQVINAAVWHTDGSIGYELRPGHEWEAHVTSGASKRVAVAISMKTLLGGMGDVADYVKVDVEGAERELLGGDASWARRIRCIKVEVHAPYTTAECATDLERAGFRTAVGPGGHVVGIRSS